MRLGPVFELQLLASSANQVLPTGFLPFFEPLAVLVRGVLLLELGLRTKNGGIA
jgi:hypothetical protein